MAEWPYADRVVRGAGTNRFFASLRTGIVRGGTGERGQVRAAGAVKLTEASMPWVVRDAVDDINRAVGRRWQGQDPWLPPRAELPEGCAAPFVAAGSNGQIGRASCRERVEITVEAVQVIDAPA